MISTKQTKPQINQIAMTDNPPTLNLRDLSTFDLAFNLAQGLYDEKQKFQVLSIIREREAGIVTETASAKAVRPPKPPLKGSKAEKILTLLTEGKSPKDVFESLNKKKANSVYYPEIYRVAKTYFPDQYGEK